MSKFNESRLPEFHFLYNFQVCFVCLPTSELLGLGFSMLVVFISFTLLKLSALVYGWDGSIG